MFFLLIRFEDPVEHAVRTAKVLREEEKCDVIIALTHVEEKINLENRTLKAPNPEILTPKP